MQQHIEYLFKSYPDSFELIMAVYFTYLCLLVLKIESAWPSSWHLQQQRIMGATFSMAESESDSYEMFVHNIALGRILKCLSGLKVVSS